MPIGKIKRTTDEQAVARATDVRFERGSMIVSLIDGRQISVPLAFYPTLAKASSAQCTRFELIGRGRGISWDELDLDLSVEGLLRGAREGIPRPPALRHTGAAKPARQQSA